VSFVAQESLKKEKREKEKEGLAGWTGLKGAWLYGGFSFKERDLLDEEQQRLIAVPRARREPRQVYLEMIEECYALTASSSLARKQPRHAS